MTSLLLDSQVALWVVTDSRELGRESRGLISRAHFVHVSAATVWELTIKAMLGRLSLPPDLARAFEQQGFSSLPVSATHAEAIMRFPDLVRHDPFDRLLMAQASCESMELVTADRVLLATGHPFLVDATR